MPWGLAPGARSFLILTFALITLSGATEGRADPTGSGKLQEPRAGTSPTHEGPVPRYQQNLERLETRQRADSGRSITFRFSRLRKVDWPPIVVASTKVDDQRRTVFFSGADPRGYSVGEDYGPCRVIQITEDRVTLQIRGETREFEVPKALPDIRVREIRLLAGQWATTLDDEKRVRYAGDSYRGAIIKDIREDRVVLEQNGRERAFILEKRAPEFPDLAISGTLQVRGRLQFIFVGVPRACSVGDVVKGARITALRDKALEVEFNGEKRSIPFK